MKNELDLMENPDHWHEPKQCKFVQCSLYWTDSSGSFPISLWLSSHHWEDFCFHDQFIIIVQMFWEELTNEMLYMLSQLEHFFFFILIDCLQVDIQCDLHIVSGCIMVFIIASVIWLGLRLTFLLFLFRLLTTLRTVEMSLLVLQLLFRFAS